ncbi:peptidylprolyl isomerase [Bradyrhizobium sp.]|uniref:peptidylprolyl isomerase n=1 Tax=Bradyrhizobium sp. TaxID=376 RepID=UPI001EBBCAD9|nr:peptidylprolyl isomerase [Bradyrhizobium sp.]MBV8918209.1 peptidylprolyl isomerase [Bradyrhizobium sp.]MBV9979803.1 peptidylprolyl isomerase [Bradyrhizobium sp.]
MIRTTVTAGLLAAVTLAAASVQAEAQTRASPPAAAPARPAAAQSAPARAAAPSPSGISDDKSAGKGDEVVARVGDSDVTAEEVRAVIASLDGRKQAALAHDPATLSQIVRGILANRLVLKEALGKKWDQQPAVVSQLARARENLIVESYLLSVAAPPENYPAEAEIKSVYDANVSAFLVPRRFQLAQILIALAKDADKAAEEAARKKLDDLVKKLKQPGADFAATARTASDDAPTAERDGEIGWVAEPDLRSEIRSQVAGLPKGGITDPIRLDDGWHIMKLEDTEASHTRPLAEVKDALVQKMRAERTEANRRAYVTDLLKQTPPVVNEIALAKLLEAKSDSGPARSN